MKIHQIAVTSLLVCSCIKQPPTSSPHQFSYEEPTKSPLEKTFTTQFVVKKPVDFFSTTRIRLNEWYAISKTHLPFCEIAGMKSEFFVYRTDENAKGKKVKLEPNTYDITFEKGLAPETFFHTLKIPVVNPSMSMTLDLKLKGVSIGKVVFSLSGKSKPYFDSLSSKEYVKIINDHFSCPQPHTDVVQIVDRT